MDLSASSVLAVLAQRVSQLYAKFDALSKMPGPAGARGEIGAAGRPGLDGARGPAGPRGEPGARGANGKDGADGKAGPQGQQGPRGPMPKHKWEGTKLSFEKPDGKWGKPVDLRGPAGAGGGGFSTTIVHPGPGNEEKMPYAKRVDFISTVVFYKGEAEVGTADAEPKWRISRTEISPDRDVTQLWADGDAEFDKTWDARATYTYS